MTVKTTAPKISWVAPDGGDWSVASNWSSGALPDSSDNVVIRTATRQTITHESGTDTIHSLKVNRDDFQLSGGSLEIDRVARFEAGFSQTGGTISAREILVRGDVSLTGGTIAGRTTFETSGKVTLGNYTLADNAKLEIGGIATQVAPVSFGLHSTIDVEAGAVYRIGDVEIQNIAHNGVISNAGTFEQLSGHGTSVISSNMTSTGLVSVSPGAKLQFGGFDSFSGTLSGNGTIAFEPNVHGASSASTLQNVSVSLHVIDLLDRGNLTIGSGVSLDVGTLVVSGGGLGAASGVSTSFSAVLLATSGYLGLDASTLTLVGKSNVIGGYTSTSGTIVNPDSLKIGNILFYSGDIINEGLVSQNGNLFNYGPSIEENRGTWTMSPDSAINPGDFSGGGNPGDFYNDALMVIDGDNSIYGTLVNNADGIIDVKAATLSVGGDIESSGSMRGAGTLDISFGTATLSTLDIGALNIGGGTVTLTSLDTSTLTIQGGATTIGSLHVNAIDVTNGTLTLGSLDTGTLNIGGGAVTLSSLDTGTLDIHGGTTTIDALHVGAFDITSGTINLGSLYTGTLNIQGGTIVVDAPHVNAIDILNGALDLTGENVSFDGNFSDLAGYGGTTLSVNNLALKGSASFIGTSNNGEDLLKPNGSSGTLITKGLTTLSYVTVGTGLVFDNRGSVQATGQLTLGSGKGHGAFSNVGSYDLQADFGINSDDRNGDRFSNHGLFEKTSGTGTSVVSSTFENIGTITVTSGTLEFVAGTLNNTGTINGVVTTDSSGDILITQS